MIVVGLVLPFYLEWSLYKKYQQHLSSALAAVCLLVGGLTLRYLILSAGTLETFSYCLKEVNNMGEVKLKRREFLKLGGITCLASTLIAPLNNLCPLPVLLKS